MDIKIPIGVFGATNTTSANTLSLVELCKNSYDTPISALNASVNLTLDDVNISPVEETYGKVPILRVENSISFTTEIETRLKNKLRYMTYLGFTHFVLVLSSISPISIKIIFDVLNKDFPTISFSLSWDLSIEFLTFQLWSDICNEIDHDDRITLFLEMPNINPVDLNLWLYQPIKYVHIRELIVCDSIIVFLQTLRQLKCLNHPTMVFDSNIKGSTVASILSTIETASPLLDELSLSVRNMLLHSNILPIEFTNPKFVLQSPLEPAIVDLPNTIYQTFESDTFKYNRYSKAILCAMMKINDNITETPLELICVGPGRGPLIDELFKAIKFLNLTEDSFNIYAVERNSAVMPYLQYKNQTDWDDKVTLYCEDIRTWNPKTSVTWSGPKCSREFKGFHLIFSELIGSFGCNELMPEVLAPMVKFQNKDECIWIPQTLDCYITPVHTPSIWNMSVYQNSSVSVPLIPYYLYLTNPVKIWSFCYGKLASHDNTRQFKTSIQLRKNIILHGFTGHFKAVLFPGIEVDNLPETPKSWESPQSKSNSWLPLYIPCKGQNQVHDNMNVEFSREIKLNQLSYNWRIANTTFNEEGCFNFNLY